jgi:hypothetical protein
MIMTTIQTIDAPEGYRAGACNIGPAEISARRRSGHLGVIATLGLLVLLVAVDAPTWTRLALFVPAAIGAAGYLQAAMRFCAAFGWAGVFNFSEHVRSTSSVVEAEARAADRRKAVQIGALSGLTGLVVALGAVALPL